MRSSTSSIAEISNVEIRGTAISPRHVAIDRVHLRATVALFSRRRGLGAVQVNRKPIPVVPRGASKKVAVGWR
jgi:hypothetical protein